MFVFFFMYWRFWCRLEWKMKVEGKILIIDFFSLEDKEWLRMDFEDVFVDNLEVVDINLFEDDDFWVKYFGEKL